MGGRPRGRVGEREEVLLEDLIAKLASQKQVAPFIGEPVVTRMQPIARALTPRSFIAVCKWMRLSI